MDPNIDYLADMVSKYGFPIVASFGLCGIVYYIWIWVTRDIKPVLADAQKILIALIDKIRRLDQDLIRLDQKVSVVLKLRKKKIERENKEDEKNDE
jgi:hypothetical protein